MTSSDVMRIVAIGECMAELTPAGRPDTFRQGFAGDTFNTAWYLARCRRDLDVAYVTAIGDDEMSRALRQFARDSGLSDWWVRVVPGGTLGLYLVSLRDGERSFSYWRGQSAARQLAQDPDELRAALRDAGLIYFSGITLAILPQEGRETLLAQVSEARSAGARVAFDPNLRPRLWDSSQAMTETVMQAARICDVALPSFEDEAYWFGDATPEATRARYAEAGAGQVVVKNGAGDLVWQDGARRGMSRVAPVARPVDTTAAGDSLNAGVLADLVHGASLEEAIARGCRLARHVVQNRGALVPLPPEV
ncbi:MAG: sugar kinase [Pseudomonadota bacterium]